MDGSLERWEDECSVCHDQPQPVQVPGDELVRLVPLDGGGRLSDGHALKPRPGAVGEDGVAGRLDPPDGSLAMLMLMWLPPSAIVLQSQVDNRQQA